MSTVKTASVHRVLAEIKLYDQKIQKALSSFNFVYFNKASNSVIGGKNLNEFKDELEGNFKKVKDLIRNRKAMKDALVKSNAETVVKIGAKDYTVASAIERKVSSVLERGFLDTLKKQLKSVNYEVDKSNDSLQPKLEAYLTAILGDKASSRDPEQVKNHTNDFMKMNQYVLVDPNHVADYIRTLEDELDEFLTNVDFALSESNAVTMVDIVLE